MSDALPLPGMVTVEGVAGTVAWLASEDASCITGHTIPVDRGYIAAGYQTLARPGGPSKPPGAPDAPASKL